MFGREPSVFVNSFIQTLKAAEEVWTFKKVAYVKGAVVVK